MLGVLFIGAAAMVAPAAGPAPPACLRARTPIAPAQTLRRANFDAAECTATIGPALRFDPTTASTHATAAIAAGDLVRAWPGADAEQVHPGDVLVLAVTAGPVRVERAVVAMQAAASGARLFVRAADGAVLSVRYESADR